MRITHIIFSLQNGGAENLLVDIVNHQSNEHTVCLVIINDKIDYSLLSAINSRVKIYSLKRIEGSFSPFLFLRMNLLLMLFNPDAIHCHNENIISTLFLFFKKKTYLTVHETNVDVNYLPKYHGLFAISKSVQQYIFSEKRLQSRVNYNGVRIGDIVQKQHLQCSHPFRIVQVSRLSHLIKGQHLLIKAISELKKKGYSIKADLIGAGESKNYLSELVVMLQLQEEITFEDNWDRKKVYDSLSNYDLLVQPSLYEGFGLTVVEAMAARVPVLASKIDGPAEIIQDEKYGYLFDTNNYYDLADKIKYIIDHYAESCDKVLSATEYVKNNFDIVLTAQRYTELYQKA